MAKAILICGKICSGKSFLAEKLKREYSAIVLSVDEITLGVLDGCPGNNHDDITERIQKYLLKKSIEIISVGVNIILDWGFWTKTKRNDIKEYYKTNGVEHVMYYIDISNEKLEQNTALRNKDVLRGKTSAFYVDEDLAKKCNDLFEPPNIDEYDYLIRCI